MRKKLFGLAAWVALTSALMAVAAAGTAWAHVEVSPTEVQPGQVEEFAVEIAGEESEPAVEVRLEVPQGFEVTDVAAPSGWTGELGEGSVVWSGGEIAEDRVAEFPFEARSPEEAGEFAWEGFVTYDGGDVVEWTGTPDSERPASVVTVASGGQTGGSGGEGDHGGEEGEDLPETGGVSPALVLGAAVALIVASGLALRRGTRT